MAAAVEIRGLTKRFGNFTALAGLTLTVARGEVFGFLGSNGAGKTTAIRALCGLLRPTAGEVRVLDVDVVADPEAVKRRLGYMSQRFSLYEDLSVIQNLRFYGGVYGLRGAARREREAWALEMADLRGKENLVTGALPGGWKQRLALACAVLHRPEVLFLDEPTSGVDPLSRRRFWQLIKGMAAEGVTVFVTTHYLDEAEQCDRLALMHAGRLLALGTVAELKTVFAGATMLEVTCPRPVEALEALGGRPWARETAVFGNRVHVLVDEGDEGRRQVRALLEEAGNRPVTVEPIAPSLEHVFIHYVEQAERLTAVAREGAA
ncbi:MAG: ABC transporter ATP-binding protein [Candidatus Krumholzibacteriia bacterium]